MGVSRADEKTHTGNYGWAIVLVAEQDYCVPFYVCVAIKEIEEIQEKSKEIRDIYTTKKYKR